MILASAILGALGVAGSSSASTLLSGYGAPGAGEQTIIGSTLLNAPASGSGGRSAGAGRAAGGVTVAPSAGESSSATGSTAASFAGQSTTSVPNGRAGSPVGGSVSERSASGRAFGDSEAEASGAAGMRGGGTGSFAYPIALRSTSAGSSALSLSGADLGEVAALIVGLLAVGVLTVRVARVRR